MKELEKQDKSRHDEGNMALVNAYLEIRTLQKMPPETDFRGQRFTHIRQSVRHAPALSASGRLSKIGGVICL